MPYVRMTFFPYNICSCDIYLYPQYLTQFQPNFLKPIFWWSKFFWTTILLDANFWDQTLFGPKMIMDLRFLDPIFLDQNYFGSKIVILTQLFFDPKYLDHNVYPNFFGPTLFEYNFLGFRLKRN